MVRDDEEEEEQKPAPAQPPKGGVPVQNLYVCLSIHDTIHDCPRGFSPFLQAPKACSSANSLLS